MSFGKEQVEKLQNCFFDGETDVIIKYHMSLIHYGGQCSGIIDPAKIKKIMYRRDKV